MTETPPLPEQYQKAKGTLNLIIAGICAGLAVWLAIADFTYPGDLAFQSSASIGIAALFVSVLFMVLMVVAALPKRFIIAANVLLLSRCAMGFPLNLWMENTTAGRIVSGAFLLVSVAYFFKAMRDAASFERRPWLKAKHTVISAVTWIVLMIATLPVFVLGYGTATRNMLGDYVGLDLTGVDSVERVFEKDGKVVHLVGMMHIGHGSFYSDLKSRLTAAPAGDNKRLILTEGVADREGIIPKDFANGKTYERFAKMLGLEAQKGSPESPIAGEVTEDQALAPDKDADPRITWRNADMDVSDLKEDHKKLLVTMLEKLSSADLAALMNPNYMKVDGRQIEDLFMNGLLLTRNNALMARFSELAPDYQEIYMPWGAAHLPDIEKRLLALGYKRTNETVRPIIRFWK